MRVPGHIPAPDVPETVYIVVDTGFTVTLLPDKLPGIQVYCNPAVAVSVLVPPTQMAVGVAATVNTGGLMTLTVAFVVPIQPAVLVPDIV